MSGPAGLSPADLVYANRRHLARLAAAQALYQLEYGGRGVEAVVTEFMAHRFVQKTQDEPAPAESGDGAAAPAAASAPVPLASPAATADKDLVAIPHPVDPGGDGLGLYDADGVFFGALVRGVVAHQADIDGALAGVLAQGWSLRRLDATARAILRAAAFEILYCDDIPAAVTLDSALGVADAFFDDTEPKFIHGALNALVKSVRSPASGVEPVDEG